MSIQSTCSLSQFDENCAQCYNPLTTVKPVPDFSSYAISSPNLYFPFLEELWRNLRIHKESTLIFEQRSCWDSQCQCVGKCF